VNPVQIVALIVGCGLVYAMTVGLAARVIARATGENDSVVWALAIIWPLLVVAMPVAWFLAAFVVMAKAVGPHR